MENLNLTKQAFPKESMLLPKPWTPGPSLLWGSASYTGTGARKTQKGMPGAVTLQTIEEVKVQVKGLLYPSQLCTP